MSQDLEFKDDSALYVGVITLILKRPSKITLLAFKTVA